MRRRTAIPFVSLLAAALSAPLTGAAYAESLTCAAYGIPPHLEPGRYDLWASGTFSCVGDAEGMRVIVCAQEQDGGLGSQTWRTLGCETAYGEGATDSISAEVGVPVMVYATFLRVTVTGTNADGHTATFTSPPIYWFNGACYIGGAVSTSRCRAAARSRRCRCTRTSAGCRPAA